MKRVLLIFFVILAASEMISPGIKFTKDSLILEALAQFPVWQDQEGLQTERDIGIIIGMRFMF